MPKNTRFREQPISPTQLTQAEESIVKLVYYYLQDHPTDIRSVDNGYMHETYRFTTEKFGDLYIRMNKDHRRLSTFLKNHWAKNKAAEKGVPVARCLVVNNSIVPYVYMIDHALPGDPANLYQGDKLPVWQQVGQLAYRTNSVRGFTYGSVLDLPQDERRQYRTWPDYVDNTANWIFTSSWWESGNILNRNEREQVSKRLAELKTWEFNPGLIHGDLLLKNVIVNDRGKVTGIIDWDDAAFARVPHAQLARIFTWITLEEQRAFLQGYGLSEAQYEEIRPEVETLMLLDHLDRYTWFEKTNQPEHAQASLERVKKILRSKY